MYRIFHGQHLLILTDTEQDIDIFEPDFIFKKPKELQIKEALKVSKKSTKELVILFIGKPDKILKRIILEFKFVEAAGGVVLNKHNDILFIKRLGKWDLPKGKLKKNESIEDCAIREVEEETGVESLSIENPLTETYHTYYRNEKWVIKKTYWFVMHCKKYKKVVPQIEEGIEAVQWMNIKGIDLSGMDTYPAIVWILKEYDTVTNSHENL